MQVQCGEIPCKCMDIGLIEGIWIEIYGIFTGTQQPSSQR